MNNILIEQKTAKTLVISSFPAISAVVELEKKWRFKSVLEHHKKGSAYQHDSDECARTDGKQVLKINGCIYLISLRLPLALQTFIFGVVVRMNVERVGPKNGFTNWEWIFL